MGEVELACARINTRAISNLHTVNQLSKSVDSNTQGELITEMEFLSISGMNPTTIGLWQSDPIQRGILFRTHCWKAGFPAGGSGICPWVPMYSRGSKKASELTKHPL